MAKQNPIRVLRVRAACAAIERAGGASKLARLLSARLGTDVTVERVQKWTTLGVPVRWGGILENAIPGVKREDLNPFEYTAYPLDIPRLERDKILRI